MQTACKYPRDVECFACSGKGHIARKAKAGKGKPQQTRQKFDKTAKPQKAHMLTAEDSNDFQTAFIVKGKRTEPFMVNMCVDGKQLEMEVDTGASVSIVSNTTFVELWKGTKKLKESTVVLRSYANQTIKVLGELVVKVVYGDQEKKLNLLVVAGKGSSLLGRDWLKQIRLNWTEIYKIDSKPAQTLHGQASGAFQGRSGFSERSGSENPRGARCKTTVF